ncbi:sulfite reductase (NADPH) hemoprotein beta-component [Moraxella cuniculi DSM 21768]|uniref:Sulfite reductase (NADPH) hemoprotein beta-component n=1 Tax=Moraxella cuniculi DSM 21768 TaxID=1122245 RepID=A0A1N7EY31_9GAMM|nr:nitrite/sulfite reductase [Moraxella cuniculi]OOS02310.1 sulfite reductase [Moraxella cuniculi]SIR92980.1 sulfite reductase (NADPH) hemoprotein beta-component [Moraxella cuniculi DSM 21768]
MYQYSYADQKLVDERVAQFRDQTERFLAGQLPEEQFLPLRLQNGLYIQRHAPMLRIAIPYGLMSSQQLRTLAEIARDYDKGYGHFTTRTNMQLNWVELAEVPDILAKLAANQMHAIQTSGNCIRNTTTDPYAGIHADEIADPRPYCEIIRQWSTFHPEFAFLPRKFKIAVIGTKADRAATQVHDIGLHLVEKDGEIGFEVLVGGGLGRTPIIGKAINEFLPRRHLLSYLDAILRVYNLEGRRDNKYKARIKILVESLGKEVFAEKVEQAWQASKDGELTLSDAHFAKAQSYFSEPAYESIDTLTAQETLQQFLQNTDFNNWYQHNTVAHKVNGYKAVIISLKAGVVDGRYVPAGDITDKQMFALAELADKYSLGEIRATHQQNLVLSDVKISDLYQLWQALSELNLARANIGTLTDMIVCPGFDYCALANATTHNIAESIEKQFDDLDYLYDLGDIRLNMSGCMNACAHHHVGDIGILGVDKKGEHWYQISLGGNSGENAKLGQILGRAVAADEVASTIATIVNVYKNERIESDDHIESFAQAVERLGIAPFKAAVYN